MNILTSLKRLTEVFILKISIFLLTFKKKIKTGSQKFVIRKLQLMILIISIQSSFFSLFFYSLK